MHGGGDGFQGCMACLRSACRCTARHTFGVQGLKAVCGGPAHHECSWGAGPQCPARFEQYIQSVEHLLAQVRVRVRVRVRVGLTLTLT